MLPIVFGSLDLDDELKPCEPSRSSNAWFDTVGFGPVQILNKTPSV